MCTLHNVHTVHFTSYLCNCMHIASFPGSSANVMCDLWPLVGVKGRASFFAWGESLETRLACKYMSSYIPFLFPEPNQNLFAKHKAMFDPKNPPKIHQQGSYTYYHQQTQQCVADTVVQLGFLSTRKRDSSGSEMLDHCTVTVSFDDVYIVNFLRLKSYPSVPNKKQQHKSFSYTVKVSRDKSSWLKLFDYFSFACRSEQNLPFPKQAVRWVQIHIVTPLLDSMYYYWIF